jgi:hypothetical protein
VAGIDADRLSAILTLEGTNCGFKFALATVCRLVFRQIVDAVPAAETHRNAIPVRLLHRRSGAGKPKCAGLGVIPGDTAAETEVIAADVAVVRGARVIDIGLGAVQILRDGERNWQIFIVASAEIRARVRT